jgi:ribosomal protein S18 acetylase RimI-like enzyme
METTEVQVRLAQPDEWAVVRDVRLAALADAPDAFASTLGRETGQTEADWRSRVAARPWFLAWQADQASGARQPAGLAAMFPEHSGQPVPPPDWHLVSMWVRPEARGAGIADRLVTAVVAHASAAGAARVTLWVAIGNGRARALYQRMGFVPTGRRQMYPREGTTDLDEEEFACPLDGARKL